MRGIAVLLVLFFHFKLGPFRGGFVGVTVFFTLSGFLICSRTLSEIDRRNGFTVADFFERRIRRLAPAAIACIVAVLFFTLILGTHEQRASVPGDAVASLANVANWRFLLHGTSYTDLFAAPSPLNHFWSLAIEEQFYLVFPLAVWLLLKLPARLRAPAVALLVSAALEWAAHASSAAGSFNRFYYGTDTRTAELAIGVILALSLHYWSLSVPRPAGRQRGAMTAVGALGLLGVVAGAMNYRNGAASYQHGGALFMALATAALILAGLEGSNVVARICSVRPLVWVGKVSYGAYLYHWPIFALSGSHWGPLRGHVLGVTQLGVSLLLAGLSFRFLEAPIQRRRFAPTRQVLLRGWARTVLLAAAVAVTVGMVNPASGPSRFASLATGLQVPGQAVARKSAVVPRTNAAVRPLRVLVTGDSTGRVMARALVEYRNAHPQLLQVLDLSMPGCPVTPADLIRDYSGEAGQNVSLCQGWQRTFAHQIDAFKPDESAVFLSVMEQTDQRMYDTGWDNVLDPAHRARQEAAFAALAKLLTATGAPVVWADAPYLKFRADLPWISDSPLRTDTLNAVYRDLAARDPRIHLLDYAAHLNLPGHAVDTRVRPDGVHMTDLAAAHLARTWLIPLLERYKPAVHRSGGANGTP